MRWIGILLLLLAGCGNSKHPLLENTSKAEDLSIFRLQSIRGTRDGDRLAVQALISDTSSILTLEMHFAIGSPTRLDSGTWRWSRGGRESSGTISARSVTFLGGQDGPPSIGGSFDLIEDGGHPPTYHVNLPLTELRQRWTL